MEFVIFVATFRALLDCRIAEVPNQSLQSHHHFIIRSRYWMGNKISRNEIPAKSSVLLSIVLVVNTRTFINP